MGKTSRESRVHNVVGLPDPYDTEHGRKQLRASILIAREFVVAIHDDPRLPAAFREKRLPQMRERLAAREG